MDSEKHVSLWTFFLFLHEICCAYYLEVPQLDSSIDLLDVIVFIWATAHVITMLCHVIKNCGWQKHFQFH